MLKKSVTFVRDLFGSSYTKPVDLMEFEESGGRIIEFNRPWHIPLHLREGLHRTHRKIVVIDYQIGYCGGMNISKGLFPQYCLNELLFNY